MKEIEKVVAENVTKLLKEKRITKLDLAKIAGVSESTVGKWTLEKATPRMGAVQKISDHFNIPKSYILEEEENEEVAQVEEQEPTNEDESTEEEEPANEEEERTEEDESELAEEEETEEVKFKHEVIDGVDVYTDFNNITISPNNYMSNFSIEMTDLLNEVHQDLTNGVVFRNATTLTDGYGNEEKKIVVNVWYPQETIEKINYDNWPVLIGEDLYSTADGVIIHFALGQDVDEDNKIASDDAPQFYRDSIGADYEE